LHFSPIIAIYPESNCRLSILNNANLLLGELDPILFPGLPDDVRAHEGFLDEHAGTISPIFEEVKRLIAETGATSISCVRFHLSFS
jgi:hypothetical protein